MYNTLLIQGLINNMLLSYCLVECFLSISVIYSFENISFLKTNKNLRNHLLIFSRTSIK